MKNALLSGLMAAVLAATMALPLGVGPAIAQDGCWDNAAIQSALAAGQIRPVADVLAREGIAPTTQVLNVKVCDQDGGPVYVLAVLEASGEARNLTVRAQ
jgi:hypothetical protein